ncbi:MAG: iron-sulfur cluster assembly scaffold protein [Patescibacteria group bacterium]
MSKLYSQKVFRHTKNPQNKGTLENPTHTLVAENPSCGDTLTMYLEVADDKIIDVGWEGEGCSLSQAASSIISEKIIGMTLDKVRALSTDNIVTELDIEVSPARLKCALLPFDALHTIQK